MAISVTLTANNDPYKLDLTSTRVILYGTVAWGAGTYAAGGVTPNAFTALLDASGQAVLLATLNTVPDVINIYSTSGSGYFYQYVKSTGKVMILVTGSAAGSPLEELPNGALPAGVTGDTIAFKAEWVRA